MRESNIATTTTDICRDCFEANMHERESWQIVVGLVTLSWCGYGPKLSRLFPTSCLRIPRWSWWPRPTRSHQGLTWSDCGGYQPQRSTQWRRIGRHLKQSENRTVLVTVGNKVEVSWSIFRLARSEPELQKESKLFKSLFFGHLDVNSGLYKFAWKQVKMGI